MSIPLFLGFLFIGTFILGLALETFRVPWLFASLLIGLFLSGNSFLAQIVNTDTFDFLKTIGLYLLLFIIGFSLDLGKIKSSGKFIVKATFIIEIAEVLVIGSLIYFIFKIPILISILVALSFATVGEAILLPILEEFRLTKKKFGQIILGIATFDDIIELFVVFAVVTIIPTLGSVNISADLFDVVRLGIFGGIVALLLVILKKFRATTSAHEPHRTSILALIFGVFFVFISFGLHSSLDIAVIGAIAAGVLVRAVLPAARTPIIGQHVQAITYSFFAPIFFFDVGFETNSKYLLSHIFLVLLFIIAAKIAKVAASYFVGSKVLGTKKSIFMGVALGVRFSTSIVILKLLYDANLVPIELYSLLIGTSVIFKFFVPLLLSFLAKRWKPAIVS